MTKHYADRACCLDCLRKYKAIKRADETGLATIVCADTIAEAQAIAHFAPNIIVAEPTELIGSGKASDLDYVQASIEAVKAIDSRIKVLQGAGISNGKDVYNVIHAGAEATGTSSGIIKAADPVAMVDEMIKSVRMAWDDRSRETSNIEQMTRREA